MTVRDAELLLRRLASNDERLLETVLAARAGQPAALDRVTRALVQLSALLAVGAPTATLRWAVELAAANGVDDAAVVQVLVAAGAAAGAAQTATNATRLALALDLDLAAERP